MPFRPPSRRRQKAALSRKGRGARAPAGPALAGDPDFMTSLARGLLVLGAFGEPMAKANIAQISRKIGIPRAAVRRCLHTLVLLGYVSADGHQFSLRPKILTLGHAYLSSTPLTVTAQPLLDRVSGTLHESCSLAVLEADEIVYVARAAAQRIMSISLRVGSRLPAYCTSMGRVLLAELEPALLDAYLSRVRLLPHTERTITSRERLLAALEAVRRSGYAVVNQELELGLCSIAVPVRDIAGKTVAAMNVGAQAARNSIKELEKQFLPTLRAAARELGSRLLPG
jgi:IclR family pca regulon transcriptional regulator